MRDERLGTIADLLRERNAIDAKIAAIIGRPMTAGHLGEWITAKIFGIELESPATSAAFDGRFTAGIQAVRGERSVTTWPRKRR